MQTIRIPKRRAAENIHVHDVLLAIHFNRWHNLQLRLGSVLLPLMLHPVDLTLRATVGYGGVVLIMEPFRRDFGTSVTKPDASGTPRVPLRRPVICPPFSNNLCQLHSSSSPSAASLPAQQATTSNAAAPSRSAASSSPSALVACWGPQETTLFKWHASASAVSAEPSSTPLYLHTESNAHHPASAGC